MKRIPESKMVAIYLDELTEHISQKGFSRFVWVILTNRKPLKNNNNQPCSKVNSFIVPQLATGTNW